MPVTLAELARLVEGEMHGEATLALAGAATLATAGAHDISLVDRADKLHLLAKSRAAAVVVPRDVLPAERPCIRVADVHAAFTQIVTHFRPQRAAVRRGISPQAIIAPTARLGADVDVHAGATIAADVLIGHGSTIHCGVHIMAGCTLGEFVTVFPGAVLYEDTVMGDRCVIHAGAVLGAWGFGYRTLAGRHVVSAQLGWVELGADVEVGANSTIDRGAYGPTLVGEGTKIDNQVQIAHNCRIGRHNLLCAQVGIAGSASTGDYVVMAGQAGVRDHVHIGQGAVLCAMAGVPSDVPAGARMLGIPATPERDQKLKLAAYHKLPEMRRQLRDLERMVAALQAASPNPATDVLADREPAAGDSDIAGADIHAAAALDSAIQAAAGPRGGRHAAA